MGSLKWKDLPFSFVLPLVSRPASKGKSSGVASIMNYVLQVVRGRSEANTIKLMDGINSVGRHDDCLIRIRSSQVSRRHCELFEDDTKLMVRDLGSANGTFVNGKRVLGQQILKSGDVLTIGGVTLRVDQAGTASRPEAAARGPAAKPSDTAEVAALPAGDEFEVDEEEFEIAFDEEPEQVDLIPLEEDEPPTPEVTKATKPAAPAPATATSRDQKSESQSETMDVGQPSPTPKSTAEEEEAVAQFLMDLKLDEDD